jgi:hypothetical protein
MKAGAIVDIQNFGEYLDYERFSWQQCSANENSIAISTNSHLLLTYLGGIERNSKSCTIVEFKNSGDRISVMKWIDENVIICGFESGLVLGFDEEGSQLFEFLGSESSVQSIKLSLENREAVLWILHENALLIGVRLFSLFNFHYFAD